VAAISRAGFLELAGLRPLFGARFSLVQELVKIVHLPHVPVL
jgi:hypothetical protein